MTQQAWGILGAGAWGTALALALRRAGQDVRIWARRAQTARSITHDHMNPDRLPGIALDPAITASDDLASLASCTRIIMACPSVHLRALSAALAPHVTTQVAVVLACKGVEAGSLNLPHEVAAQEMRHARHAVLSGPSFAHDVALGLPTALTLACADIELGHLLAHEIGTPHFRPYVSTDVIGACMGGAVKNVLAIACGIAKGRELGDNARAALITRGFAEMSRLGLAMGARAETLIGLSGLGDLVLTGTSGQSRNYSLGFALGRDLSLEEAMPPHAGVAEGLFSAQAVVALAQRHHVDMPIARAVDAVVNQGTGVGQALHELLSRPLRDEVG